MSMSAAAGQWVMQFTAVNPFPFVEDNTGSSNKLTICSRPSKLLSATVGQRLLRFGVANLLLFVESLVGSSNRLSICSRPFKLLSV